MLTVVHCRQSRTQAKPSPTSTCGAAAPGQVERIGNIKSAVLYEVTYADGFVLLLQLFQTGKKR